MSNFTKTPTKNHFTFMTTNTYKEDNTNNNNNASNNLTDKELDFSTKTKTGIFQYIDKLLNLDFILNKKFSTNYIPYLLFTTFIGVIYIANTHYSEKNQKKIIQLEKEVGNLRTEYITIKADYMSASKQSEVVKKAVKLGLKEPTKAPYQIK